MITAKVVADSKNPQGDRLTTIVVTFPRIILAELNTHRMMSRNSASSRAIPFEKMLKSVQENPFIPIAWQRDHSGMQGTEYLTGHDAEVSEVMWLEARDTAVEAAKDLADNGTTKQLCNRLLEPFMWHTVIVSATEWENFFYLRCPKYNVADISETGEVSNKKSFRSWKDFVHYQMVEKKCNRNVIEQLEATNTLDRLKLNVGQAEIHMMALAEAMWDAFNESVPKELEPGEWHVPFGDNMKGLMEFINPAVGDPKARQMSKFVDQDYYNNIKIKVATARCARVSYTVVGEEGKADNYENDIKLHDRLAASGHWSPFEHCAQAMVVSEYSGNFKGFRQYRKQFNNENVTN